MVEKNKNIVGNNPPLDYIILSGGYYLSSKELTFNPLISLKNYP